MGAGAQTPDHALLLFPDHQPGAGQEVAQLGLEQAPIQEADIVALAYL